MVLPLTREAAFHAGWDIGLRKRESQALRARALSTVEIINGCRVFGDDPGIRVHSKRRSSFPEHLDSAASFDRPRGHVPSSNVMFQFSIGLFGVRWETAE